MKQLFSFVILILLLSGCSKPVSEGDLPFDHTSTKEVVAFVPTITKTVSPTPEPTETYALISTPFPEVEVDNDYFVYSLYYEDRTMMLYLVDQDLQFEILPDVEIRDFALSSRNQLAYCVIEDDEEILFLSEYPFSGKNTQIISKGKSEYRNFSWSLNGQYLAFTQETNNEKMLIIWNGYTTFQIFEINHFIGGLEWNLDNNLAFTEYYSQSTGDDPSEVFIWNGLEILNVSQNPEGTDRSPVWSRDGRLAFFSVRNREFNIFVWDGYSVKEGLPDKDSYRKVAPEYGLTYISYPKWSNEDEIAFNGVESKPNVPVQFYVESDGIIRNISENNLSSFGGNWSSDGYVAFITYYFESPSINIKDNNNRLIATFDGKYTPAWGENGDLLFCQFEENKWIMNKWDRENVIEIAIGWQVIGQWPNGELVYCSSG